MASSVAGRTCTNRAAGATCWVLHRDLDRRPPLLVFPLGLPAMGLAWAREAGFCRSLVDGRWLWLAEGVR